MKSSLTNVLAVGEDLLREFCKYTLLFISSAFFQLALVLLNFSWIELLMLLRCCLLHIGIIMLRHFLYLIYLCPCLELGRFMSYLCDIFFIFIFIFIMINRMNTDTCSFGYFLEYVLLFLHDNVNEECE